jgi:ribosomal protein L40E
MSVYLSTVMRGFGIIRPFCILICLGILLLLFNLTIGNVQAFEISRGGSVGTLPLETDNYWYIDNEIRIKSRLDFLNGNVVINSTGKIIIGENGKLNLEHVNIGFNSSGVGIPTIHVLDGGELYIDNMTSRITYSNESKLIYKLIIDKNGTLEMNACDWVLGNNDSMRSGFIIHSSKIKICNSTFSNGYTGLLFENTNSISISRCSFYGNNYGCMILNTSNIEFDNCTFWGNYVKDIKLVNSHLSVINLNLSYLPITKGLELDNTSKYDVYWHLNIIVTDKSDKPLSSVQILIMDGNDAEVFVNETNETGQLTGIKLLQQTVYHNMSLDYNPFKIKASKDRKDKKDYTGTFYIELSKANSSTTHTLELKKGKEDDASGFDDPLMLFCICGMTIVTVFLILMSINVYLARKKVGLDKYSTIGGINKDQRVYGSDSELITCSECGTQVSDDATFCPHCGEYFEGEEVFCPGCNARINEKAESCPKCGRIFEEEKSDKKEKSKSQVDITASDKRKETKSKSKTEKLLCSECGAVVVGADTECPGCGSVFKEHSTRKTGKVAQKITQAEELQESKGGKEAKEVYEAKKGKQGKELEKRTKSLESSEDLEDSDYIKGDHKDAYMCSICGAGVSSKTKICPKCGTELE